MSNILYTKFSCLSVPEVLLADHRSPNVVVLLDQRNGEVPTLVMIFRQALSTTKSYYSTSIVQYLRYSVCQTLGFAGRTLFPLLPALHPPPSLHLGENFLGGVGKEYYWVFYALASRACRKSRSIYKEVMILGVSLAMQIENN